MALTLPASHGVKKPKKHRDLVAKSVATSLLKDALAEQTLPSMRDKVSAAVRELERPQTIARKRAKSFRNTSALSERCLWEADHKHTYAFRDSCRILCAGQPFAFLGKSTKAQCVPDIGRLLGYQYDAKTFPARGGRSFIAGVLSTLLGRPVSLVDMIRWFPVLNSGSMSVHPELLGLLRSLGMTWPPNAHVFPDCKETYRPTNKSASGLVQACESVQTSTSVVESATFLEEMSAILDDSVFGTSPLEALEDDMQDLA